MRPTNGWHNFLFFSNNCGFACFLLNMTLNKVGNISFERFHSLLFKYFPTYCANHENGVCSYRTGLPCLCEGFAEKLLIVDAECLVGSSLRSCASLAQSSTSTCIKYQHLCTQVDHLEQPHQTCEQCDH